MRAHAGGPRTVQRLGDIQQRIAEGAHGRFREHHQVRAAGFGLAGVVLHEVQIPGKIAAGDDLSKCNPHNYLQFGVFFQYATLNKAVHSDTSGKQNGAFVRPR